MSYSNQQKGISLLLIVVIAAVILSIGLGISSILLSQVKLMRNLGDSVIAFYAADSGMEFQLNDFYHNSPPASSSRSGPEEFSNGASYDVVVTCSQKLFDSTGCDLLFPPDSNCPADHCIKSIGSFRETKRAVKATIGSE